MITAQSALPSTVVIVGHPANGVTATKMPDGRWLTNDLFRRVVDEEDITKGSRIVYAPGRYA